MQRLALIIIFILIGVKSSAQTTNVDSLINLISILKADTNKVLLLNEVSKALLEKDSESALEYSNQMLELSKKLAYLKGIAQAYTNISRYYENQEDLNLALRYARLNYETNQKRGDRLLVSKSLHNIAWLYECLGEHHTALNYAYKKIAIVNDVNPIDKEKRLVQTYCIMGVMFKNLKQYDSAFYYLNLSEKIAYKLNDLLSLSYVLVNKGIAYEELADYANAERVYLMAIPIAKQANFLSNLSGMYTGLANVYFGKKNYTRSVDYATLGLSLAKESGNKLWEVYCYEALIKAYSAKEDYKTAFFYSGKLKNLKDTLSIVNNAKELSRMRAQFETSEKEKEIQLLEKDKSLATVTSRKQRAIIVSVISVLLLLLLVLFTSIWLFRKNKIQKETEFARSRLEFEQKLLRSQMNPHFIFNCLQAITNFTGETKVKKYLSSFGSVTRSVLENSRMDMVSIKKEVQLLEHYLQLQKMLYGNRFEYSITVSPDIEEDLMEIPPMLAQPFIENAIEHGFKGMNEGGLIEVSFEFLNESIILKIRDNGVGISKVSETQHRSLATTITQERIQVLNKRSKRAATFTVAEAFPLQESKGVLVTFELPV